MNTLDLSLEYDRKHDVLYISFGDCGGLLGDDYDSNLVLFKDDIEQIKHAVLYGPKWLMARGDALIREYELILGIDFSRDIAPLVN